MSDTETSVPAVEEIQIVIPKTRGKREGTRKCVGCRCYKPDADFMAPPGSKSDKLEFSCCARCRDYSRQSRKEFRAKLTSLCQCGARYRDSKKTSHLISKKHLVNMLQIIAPGNEEIGELLRALPNKLSDVQTS